MKIKKIKIQTAGPPRSETEVEVRHFESIQEAVDKLGAVRCLHYINYHQTLNARSRWRNQVTGWNHSKENSYDSK